MLYQKAGGKNDQSRAIYNKIKKGFSIHISGPATVQNQHL